MIQLYIYAGSFSYSFPLWFITRYIAAKSLQSCPTLCDPIDGSSPGSPVPGILQARTPEWVAISFSNAWKWEVKVKSLSRARLLATPCTAAYQAPPSMGFSRQEYWSGVPLPSPIYYLAAKSSVQSFFFFFFTSNHGNLYPRTKSVMHWHDIRGNQREVEVV